MKKEWGVLKMSMKGKSVRKGAAIGLSLIMASAVLSACSGASNDKTEKRVLRIGLVSGSSTDSSYVRQQFTDTFEYTHPNIELQFAYATDYQDQAYEMMDPTKKQPDPYEKMKELMTGTNPVDVVLFDYNQLARMTQDGLLQQLDPLITKDKFDISDFVPTVIDGIKDAGDNNIYALTPTFTGSALFYNKKIFQDAGVQPPTDNMTWNQVFDLARKVSSGTGKDQKFGIQIDRFGWDAYRNLQTYVQPLQLKIFDDKQEKMLVDSGDAWKNAWKTIAEQYKNKVMPTQQDIQKISEAYQQNDGGKVAYNPFNGDLFNSGNLGMVISGNYFVTELINAKKAEGKIKGFKPVDWDVVTVPTFEEKPGVGIASSLGNMMGINAKAQNQDDAWELIKFLNGKEWAKLKSRATYEIPSRQEFIKPLEGLDYNIKAFYSLKPVLSSDLEQDRIVRQKPGIQEVYSMPQQLFQEVLDGKKSVDEAINEWAAKGNVVLQKLKANPNGDSGATGGVSVLGK